MRTGDETLNAAAESSDPYDLLARNYTWEAPSTESFLAVKFELRTQSRFKLSFALEGDWLDGSAYWFDWGLVDWTYPLAAAQVHGGRASFSSCELRGDSNAPFSSCPSMPHSDQGQGSNLGTLDPGTYLLFGAAYGAASADIRARLSADEPINVALEEAGQTSIVAFGSDSETPGQTTAIGVSWNVGETFVGSLWTRGGPQPEWYDVRKEGRTWVNFSNEALRGANVPLSMWRIEGDGRTAKTPFFGGSPGAWEIRGQITPGNETSFTMLGLIEKPSFVHENGTWHALGPGVREDDAWRIDGPMP